MTLQDFQNAINGKFFISLTGRAALDFTALNEQGQLIRAAATNAGVLVFLPSITKFFAKGHYYGIDKEEWDNLSDKVEELETIIQSMGEPLENLAVIVANHTTAIGHPAEDQQVATGIYKLTEDVADHETRIHTLEEEIESIIGGDLRDLVEQLVNETLQNLGYQQTIQDIYNQLGSKASSISFQALAEYVGCTISESGGQASVSPSLGTHTDPTTQEIVNDTVVYVLNELRDTTQSLQVQVNDLLPKFEIKAVKTLPDVNSDEVNMVTIYLWHDEAVDSQENNLYTEYIKIKNPAHTGEPGDETDEYVWEIIGQQSIKIANYLDADQIREITDDLQDYIDTIIEKIGDTSGDTITSQIQALQNSVNYLITKTTDPEGQTIYTFNLTGENIKTTATGNTTIAEDILTLYSSKLNNDALQWQIINETI